MRMCQLFALALGAVALVALAPPSAEACWWGHGHGWGYGGSAYYAPGPAYYGPGPMYAAPPPPAYGPPGAYYGPPPGPVMTPGPGAPGAMRMMPGAPGPVPMPAPTTAASVTVSAKDDRFDPPTLNVQPGTTVRFTNSGAHPHTVTDRGGKFDSGDIAPGQSYNVTFQTPGTYHYYCKRHKGMEGTITVGEPGKAPAAGGGAGPSRGPTY